MAQELHKITMLRTILGRDDEATEVAKYPKGVECEVGPDLFKAFVHDTKHEKDDHDNDLGPAAKAGWAKKTNKAAKGPEQDK